MTYCGEVETLSQVEVDTCDGDHPETGQRCVLGDHKGYHRTADGAEWLDD